MRPKMSASPLFLRSRFTASVRTNSTALRDCKKAIESEVSPSMSSSRSRVSPSSRRISPMTRLPLGSSCLLSMLPLHSAVASARLRSILSAESQSWGWIPQGISMPL